MVVDALLNGGHDVVPIIAPRRPLTGLSQWRQLHSNAIENRRLRYECHWECDSTTVSDVSQVIPHKSKLTFSLECECLSKYVHKFGPPEVRHTLTVNGSSPLRRFSEEEFSTHVFPFYRTHMQGSDVKPRTCIQAENSAPGDFAAHILV
jgi:hypothetical protein